MSNEWKDLPTMQDVAAAQAAGHEIEYLCDKGNYKYEKWKPWSYLVGWYHTHEYRSRPVPKTRKVKMLAWFDGRDLFWRPTNLDIGTQWKRVPAEDKEIEVMK